MSRRPWPRLRTWLASLGAAPGRVASSAERVESSAELVARIHHRVEHDLARRAGELAARTEEVGASVEELRRRIEHAERSGVAEREVAAARYEHLVRHLSGSDGRVLPLADRLVEQERVARGQARITRELVAAAARDAEVEHLLAGIDPVAARRPGVSVTTIAWNHAAFLPRAIDSARDLLAALPAHLRGDIWVLDDASTDHTADVLARLGGDVRAIRAGRSLGLSRARDVLLHAVPTTHALILDADNTVEPAMAEVARLAVEHDAAFAYGVVLVVDPDGRPLDLLSTEPPGVAYYSAPANSIDSMAVVDVATVLALGGYTRDPVLEPADDWELLHRLGVHHRPILHVPRIVGRYLRTPLNHSAGALDGEAIAARIERAYRLGGRLAAGAPAAIVVDPVVGPLDGADDDRGPDAGAGPTVLVVAPGGVRNLGDDLITRSVVDRVRRTLPDARIDVVTDGSRLDELGADAAWLGRLADVVRAPGVDADTGPGSPVVDLEPPSLLVLAGGGTLADHWPDAAARRLALAEWATAHDARVVASGLGLGPLQDPRARSAVARLLAVAGARSVRDPFSAALAGELGAAVDVVTDDAVGLLEPLVERRREALVLQVRAAVYSGGSGRWSAWADTIDRLAALEGLEVVGLAVNDQERPPEIDLLAELADAPGRSAGWRLVDALAEHGALADALRRADGVVTASYHVALFALLSGVPALLVAGTPYYDAKVEGLEGLLGVSGVAVGDPPDADGLRAALDHVAAQLDPDAADHHRRLADEWFARAVRTALGDRVS